MRLHKYAKFATFGGPSILTCFSPMLMSKKTWDRLTPDQRQNIEEAAEISDTYFEMSQLEAESFFAFLEDSDRECVQDIGPPSTSATIWMW